MVSGGVESVVMNYFKNIDKSKIQFDFIIDEDSSYIPREEIEKLGGRIYFVPPYQQIIKYIPSLITLLKENQYEIVHSHINALSVFPLFAAEKAGVPIRIAHSHSTANNSEMKKTMMKSFLRPFSKVFSTHCCTCSALAGEWLFGERFYKSGRVKLIPNAIEISDFSFNEESRAETRNELGIENNFVIGHVGRFTFQKNHDFLIDIFLEVKKYEPKAILLLIGDGELEGSIRDKVARLGLINSVRFLGIRNDVHRLMQAMDIFLLPSYYEGLPVVGVESQSAGLPCIYSKAITSEAKILDTTEFINLNEPIQKWARKVLQYKDGYERKKVDQLIIKSGFEIKTAANHLKDYYHQLLSKEDVFEWSS